MVDNFVNVQQVSLGDIVLRQFFDLLQSGVYKAGDKLPCERDMCMSLNVSRPVLREVLSVLRHLGYIETVQGGGTYICDHPLTPAVNSIKFNLAAESMKAFEIWEIRNVLETELAGMVAERAGDKELASMNEAYAQYKYLVESHASQDLINRASCRFHDTIASAAHNDTMCFLLSEVAGMLSASREKTGRVDGSNERSVREHGKIAEAITMRDPAAARQAMREHMQSVKSDLEYFLHMQNMKEDQCDQ